MMAMSDTDELKLIRNRKDILKDVRFTNVKDHLISNETLSSKDVEDIESEKTPHDKMGALLDLLPKRGAQAYGHFCDALNEQFSWIVDKMNSTVTVKLEEERKLVRSPYKEFNHEVIRIVTQSEAVKDYKSIVRLLGLTEAEIHHEEYANMMNVTEQFYQCLLKWQNKKGKNATVKVLSEALRNCGYSKISDKLDGYVE